MKPLHDQMEEAWSFVWDKLFCLESDLVYEYLTSHDNAARVSHLP